MIALENINTLLTVILFSIPRLTAVLVVAPFLSAQLLTGLVRNIVIVNLTIIIIPMVAATMPTIPMTTMEVIFILAKETFIGMIMGLIVGIVFFVADAAGSFIDTQRGSSMGQIFDPVLGDQGTNLGSLFTKIVLLLFFTGGGFMAFLAILYNSYKIWPIFSFFPNLTNPVFPTFILEIADEIMRKTVLISAPLAIIMFLVEFGLGMMNRFAQQLNVFSLSMPIKSGVAMFILVIYLKIIIELFNIQMADDRKMLVLLEKIFS